MAYLLYQSLAYYQLRGIEARPDYRTGGAGCCKRVYLPGPGLGMARWFNGLCSAFSLPVSSSMGRL